MDRQVEHCLSCGYDVGIGRFCVNCGSPKPELVSEPSQPPPTDPSRRAPVSPPPVYEAPPPARYPLFADETGHASTTTPLAPAPAPSGLEETTVAVALSPASGHPPFGHHRHLVRPRWIAAAVAAVMLLGGGGWMLLSDSDSDSDPDLSASDGPISGSADPTTAPDPPEADDGSGEDDKVDPLDLTRLASASPPGTAAPSRDVRGNAVRYEAFNMLDAQPDTAWRMPGDASGQEVVFRLDGPTRITQVGLLNGYAKVEPGYDGYAANRRITSVEWIFSDGSVVPQTLDDDLSVQSIPLSDVVSDTVTLRILTVTEPAAGSAGRDYTAISDVSLVGSPA